MSSKELLKVGEHLYVPADFAKHHYYYADADGTKAYTGITTILGVLAKPALIPWAARMAVDYIRENCEEREDVGSGPAPDYVYHASEYVLEKAKSAHTRKKEEAGAHGTDAHALVEEYVNLSLANGGGPVSIGGAWGKLAPISSFITWAVENVDHFLFSERRMAHPELFIAGTADFAYVGKDGRRYMADFKTSGGIYGIDYWLQVAAYRLLAEAEGDEPYDGATIVRLGKDGSFEVQHLYDYETYKEAFLACLTLYRAQANLKGLVVH